MIVQFPADRTRMPAVEEIAPQHGARIFLLPQAREAKRYTPPPIVEITDKDPTCVLVHCTAQAAVHEAGRARAARMFRIAAALIECGAIVPKPLFDEPA